MVQTCTPFVSIHIGKFLGGHIAAGVNRSPVFVNDAVANASAVQDAGVEHIG